MRRDATEGLTQKVTAEQQDTVATGVLTKEMRESLDIHRM